MSALRKGLLNAPKRHAPSGPTSSKSVFTEMALSKFPRQSSSIRQLKSCLKNTPRCSRLLVIGTLPHHRRMLLASDLTHSHSFAQGIFEALVVGESAPRLFRKLKALHAAFPYFLVRQAFKFGGSSTMAKYLQDILLFRPFGSKSLLQK